jgi:hypothetical protein
VLRGESHRDGFDFEWLGMHVDMPICQGYVALAVLDEVGLDSPLNSGRELNIDVGFLAGPLIEP